MIDKNAELINKSGVELPQRINLDGGTIKEKTNVVIDRYLDKYKYLGPNGVPDGCSYVEVVYVESGNFVIGTGDQYREEGEKYRESIVASDVIPIDASSIATGVAVIEGSNLSVVLRETTYSDGREEIGVRILVDKKDNQDKLVSFFKKE